MIGEESGRNVENEEQVPQGSPPCKGEKSLVNSLDLELNRERLSLHNEVVKWCTDQIKRSAVRNPLAPVDPSQYFKDKLCDLQIEVLTKSSEIAVLQSRLTELIIQSPGSTAALQDLKAAMDSVTVKRNTNGYGYGQEVVNIACTTLDSVKVLVDQVGIPDTRGACDVTQEEEFAAARDPLPETPGEEELGENERAELEDKVEMISPSPRKYRSQSEALIQNPKRREEKRPRSNSTAPVSSKVRHDIRTLSNL